MDIAVEGMRKLVCEIERKINEQYLKDESYEISKYGDVDEDKEDKKI